MLNIKLINTSALGGHLTLKKIMYLIITYANNLTQSYKLIKINLAMVQCTLFPS